MVDRLRINRPTMITSGPLQLTLAHLHSRSIAANAALLFQIGHLTSFQLLQLWTDKTIQAQKCVDW